MAIQISVAVQNAILDAFETTVGTAAKMEIRTGSQPANCAAAATGTLLATLALPSDYMNAASANSKTKLGTWSVNAGATGTAAHFRITTTDGATCHMQGSVTVTGGGGDLTLDSVSLVSGIPVVISGFTLAAANS